MRISAKDWSMVTHFSQQKYLYIARNMNTVSLVDFSARRSRLAFPASRAVPRKIEILAAKRQWGRARKKRELQMAKQFLETIKTSKNAQFRY